METYGEADQRGSARVWPTIEKTGRINLPHTAYAHLSACQKHHDIEKNSDKRIADEKITRKKEKKRGGGGNDEKKDNTYEKIT